MRKLLLSLSLIFVALNGVLLESSTAQFIGVTYECGSYSVNETNTIILVDPVADCGAPEYYGGISYSELLVYRQNVNVPTGGSLATTIKQTRIGSPDDDFEEITYLGTVEDWEMSYSTSITEEPFFKIIANCTNCGSFNLEYVVNVIFPFTYQNQTPDPLATSTDIPTSTPSPTPTASDTPDIGTPTTTPTPRPSATPTATPSPITPAPSATPTSTATNTPTAENTPANTPTPTPPACVFNCGNITTTPAPTVTGTPTPPANATPTPPNFQDPFYAEPPTPIPGLNLPSINTWLLPPDLPDVPPFPAINFPATPYHPWSQ
jgi:hypothetical protein